MPYVDVLSWVIRVKTGFRVVFGHCYLRLLYHCKIRILAVHQVVNPGGLKSREVGYISNTCTAIFVLFSIAIIQVIDSAGALLIPEVHINIHIQQSYYVAIFTSNVFFKIRNHFGKQVFYRYLHLLIFSFGILSYANYIR